MDELCLCLLHDEVYRWYTVSTNVQPYGTQMTYYLRYHPVNFTMVQTGDGQKD